MSNNTYDILVFIAKIVLPALATFYIALAAQWGFPYPEKVAGSIMALDFLLAAILGITKSQMPTTPVTTRQLAVELGVNPNVQNDRPTGIFIKLSKEQYDFLLVVAMYILPGLSTFVLAISFIWHWPYVDELTATFAALDVFLGAILAVSTAQYKKEVEALTTS
jgi:hypothetical protein